MSNIKVLDCTLRDGGYINNWNFEPVQTKEIITLLDKARIDYIEIGFFTDIKEYENKTLYNSFEIAEKFLPDNINPEKLFAMIKFGEFAIDKIPDAHFSKIKGLRLIFKKCKRSEALNYCKALKAKGYKLFINPTFINEYSDKELLELIEEINTIQPYGMSIVDSIGALQEDDIKRLFCIIDTNLDKSISLCFHSHNNLQLSFSNSKSLLKFCTERKLIIDAAVLGMGRGAGNLCTELITKYINDNYNGKYNIIPVLKIIGEYINPIFSVTPWGYSLPYYLTAVNFCHPGYASYLTNNIPVEFMNEILKNIPQDKKSVFDENLIMQICNKFSRKQVKL